MEPWAIELATAAAKQLIDSAGKFLHRAEEDRAQVLEACDRYLRAANESVRGLSAEVEEILDQAADTPRTSDDIRQLWHRIDSYLHKDRLHRELLASIGGLRACAKVLTELSKGPALPSTLRKRRSAVVDLELLTKQLEVYEEQLRHFDTTGLKHRATGTGVAATELNGLWMVLKDRDELDQSARQSIEDSVQAARARSTETFNELMAAVQVPLVTLRAAFR